MNLSKHIALLYNNKAGKGKALHVAISIEHKLLEKKISFQIFDTKWPDNLTAFTEVWLIGGDGTLNFFINKYQDINIPIAMFKGGSGNDFAWKLYGNLSVDDYFDRAISEKIMLVDAGLCNGKYFLNGVGIGFDGEVVQAMGLRRFISAGHIAYLAVVIQKIFTYKEQMMQIEIDGKITRSKFLMIHIANASRYGGGFMVAPQAKIDDGKLDVICCHPLSRLKRIWNLPKIEKGTHLNLPFIDVSTCKKIKVSTDQKITAHLEGELMIAPRFEIEIVPKKFLFRY